MTFNPRGDPAGPRDGHSGSLFITGHDRLAYGELPDGSQVAEGSIPAPSTARSVAALPQPRFLQGFRNLAAGWFTDLDEIPRIGLQYLDTRATGLVTAAAPAASNCARRPRGCHGAGRGPTPVPPAAATLPAVRPASPS